MFYAMLEIVGQLAEVAEGEGLFDFREEEVQQAVYYAAQQVYAMNAELFPQEEMTSDAQVLDAAVADGSFDQEYRNLVEMGEMAA